MKAPEDGDLGNAQGLQYEFARLNAAHNGTSSRKSVCRVFVSLAIESSDKSSGPATVGNNPITWLVVFIGERNMLVHVSI